MGKLVEMLWDCPYCETKGIPGRYRDCPNCGNPRGDGIKFYMPGEIKYVDEKTAETINKNPDWKCSFCGSLNSDSDKECKSCAAPRTDSDKNYFDLQKEAQMQKKEVTEKEIPEREPIQDKSPRRKRRILSLVILAILLFALSFIPHKEVVKVTALSWNRAIQIEQLETMRESDWKLPSDARVVEKKEELHHYKKILDHYETKTRTKSRQVIDGYETVVTGYEDLGNGYSEEVTEQRPIYRTEYYEEEYQEPIYRKVPVFMTKYYYDIDKWKKNRSVKTKGNDNAPYWGEVILEEKEREGEKSEEYKITVNDKDKKSKPYILKYSDWSKIEKNDSITIWVNFWGGISKIKDADGNVIELK